MSLAFVAKALSWLWGVISSPFAWFLAGRLSGRAKRAESALRDSQRAREIDDEVAGLDEPALDSELRPDP